MANQTHSSGKDNPGNFANDRERASQAGQMGGQAGGQAGGQHHGKDERGGQMAGQQHGTAHQQPHQGKEANPGNFANDRERAAEAGRKGGQESHGGGGSHRK